MARPTWDEMCRFFLRGCPVEVLSWLFLCYKLPLRRSQLFGLCHNGGTPMFCQRNVALQTAGVFFFFSLVVLNLLFPSCLERATCFFFASFANQFRFTVVLGPVLRYRSWPLFWYPCHQAYCLPLCYGMFYHSHSFLNPRRCVRYTSGNLSAVFPYRTFFHPPGTLLLCEGPLCPVTPCPFDVFTPVTRPNCLTVCNCLLFVFLGWKDWNGLPGG